MPGRKANKVRSTCPHRHGAGRGHHTVPCSRDGSRRVHAVPGHRVRAGVAEGDLDHGQEPNAGRAAAIHPIGDGSASTTCAANESTTAQTSTTAGRVIEYP